MSTIRLRPEARVTGAAAAPGCVGEPVRVVAKFAQDPGAEDETEAGQAAHHPGVGVLGEAGVHRGLELAQGIEGGGQGAYERDHGGGHGRFHGRGLAQSGRREGTVDRDLDVSGPIECALWLAQLMLGAAACMRRVSLPDGLGEGLRPHRVTTRRVTTARRCVMIDLIRVLIRVEMEASMRARIFLSWCHQDRALKDALLLDLLPSLGVFTDLSVEWWEDSHLNCGEELTAGIVGRLDEADFGLLLLSSRFFGRPFIRTHELPRFAGQLADTGSLPVALSPLPVFGPEHDLGGIEHQVVFTCDGRSFAELSGARRRRFANELAAAIRRRALSLNGYRTL